MQSGMFQAKFYGMIIKGERDEKSNSRLLSDFMCGNLVMYIGMLRVYYVCRKTRLDAYSIWASQCSQ